jgi:hypothetical protein
MDLDAIIRELLAEHKKLDNLIRTLEKKGPGGAGPQPKRRGRKFMDSAGRREVSERMRQYWAKRREQQGAPAGLPDEPEKTRAQAA